MIRFRDQETAKHEDPDGLVRDVSRGEFEAEAEEVLVGVADEPADLDVEPLDAGEPAANSSGRRSLPHCGGFVETRLQFRTNMYPISANPRVIMAKYTPRNLNEMAPTSNASPVPSSPASSKSAMNDVSAARGSLSVAVITTR